MKFRSKDGKTVINTKEDLEKCASDITVSDFLDKFTVEQSNQSGRPSKKLNDPEYLEKLKIISEEKLTPQQISERFGVSQSTAYRMFRNSGSTKVSIPVVFHQKLKKIDDSDKYINEYILKSNRVLNENDRRKTRSFSLSDKTYNHLIEKKEEMGFYGSLSDYLSYLIDKL